MDKQGINVKPQELHKKHNAHIHKPEKKPANEYTW